MVLDDSSSLMWRRFDPDTVGKMKSSLGSPKPHDRGGVNEGAQDTCFIMGYKRESSDCNKTQI